MVPPFDFTPFYLTTRFESILKNAGGDYKFTFKKFDEDLFYIYGASAILEIYYGYNMSKGSPSMVDIKDKKSKFTRSYQLAYNADLTEMIPTDKAPKITNQDYKDLMDDFFNIDLWKEKFPPDSYIMRGVGIANLMEVTQDKSLSNITSNLLTKTPESLEQIMNSLKNLFAIPDLEGGFVEYKNGRFLVMNPKEESAMKSFVLGDDSEMTCSMNLGSSSYQQMIVDKKPLIITDTDKFHKQSPSLLSQRLKENKAIGSFVMAPLIHNDASGHYFFLI
jgi:hypothetical protein